MVKYSHPYMAYRDIDWDKAATSTAAGICSARTEDAFGAEIARMLSSLADPATVVVAGGDKRAGEKHGRVWWIDQETLGVTVPAVASEFDTIEADLARERPKVKRLLFDVRDIASTDATFLRRVRRFYDRILPQFIRRPVVSPRLRYLMQTGLRDQRFPMRDGPYWTSFQSELAGTVLPAKDAVDARIGFLANRGSLIPRQALALVASGNAMLISSETLDDSIVLDILVSRLDVPLTQGVRALVRTMELEDTDLKVTTIRSSAQDDDVVRAATRKLADGQRGDIAAKVPTNPPIRYRQEDRYDNKTFPSLELRILAGYRLVGALELLYPFLDKINNWEAIKVRTLERLIQAKSADEYAFAIASISRDIPDSHLELNGNSSADVWSQSVPPVECRPVEGRPVIVGFAESNSADVTGLKVGDEILEVDGRKPSERIAQYDALIGASTPGNRLYLQHRILLAGPKDSAVNVVARAPNGAVKRLTLKRTSKLARSTRLGEVFRRITRNIVYIDLDRLDAGDVDAALASTDSATGLILDLRGYPRGTAWRIAARINTRRAAWGAIALIPMMFRGSPRGTAFRIPDEIPDDPKRFLGQVVVLIDESAQSHSEHSALLFEAANDVTVVGSTSAGTNGNVTNLVFPGGLSLRITGMETRHADGRPFQAIGVVPQVVAKPTIRGVAAGRDEVLEAAVALLKRKTGQR